MRYLKQLSPFFLISLIGLVIYANALHGEFQFDDAGFIVENKNIRDIKDVGAIWQALDHPVRFVVFYSFALNYALHQLDVFGYHLVNIIIHIFNAILLYWFIQLLCRTPTLHKTSISQYKNHFALLTSLLFLVHPVQTQAVAYISQRFASLATLFFLGSVCSYLKARLLKKHQALFFVGSFIFAVLGMLSKEIVMTLPLVILLVEFTFFPSSHRQNFKWIHTLPLIFLLILIPTLYQFEKINLLTMSFASSSHVGDIINSQNYLLTQFRVILTYIRILILPLYLNLDYDFALSYSLWHLPTLLSLLCIIGLCVSAFLLRKKQPLIAFGILWFFITLLVESSIIPIQHVIFEHRCYLPSIGFAIVFVNILFILFKDTKIRYRTLAFVLVVFSLLTIQRNTVWQTNIALWTDVVRKSPLKARGYLNLGNAYFNQKLFGQALTNFEQAIHLHPEFAKAYNNRGNVYLVQKKYPLAIHDYQKALELSPTYEKALDNLGTAYKNLGQYDLAIEQYNKALDINPEHISAYINRGNIYKDQGDFKKAYLDYKMALSLNPSSASAHNNMGDIFLKQQNYKLAIKYFEDAIALNPLLTDGYYNLAVTYATLNQTDKALNYYEKVIKIDPNYIQAINNRGNLYQTLGKYQLAIKDYDRVLKLSPDLALAYYNRSTTFAAQQNYTKALEDVLKAYELGFDVNPLYITRLKEAINSN